MSETTYKLVRFSRPREIVLEGLSFDAAQAAYNAVTAELEGWPAATFAVRSAEDPAWVERYLSVVQTKDRGVWRIASDAVREWRRREIGATATAIIKGSGAELPLHKVEGLVRESLKAREIKVERHEVEDAVKRRVVIGRCRRHGGKAFWFPKSQGRLAGAHCDVCGLWLNQTTLALQATFHRLPKEAIR